MMDDFTQLNNLAGNHNNTERMPVLFVGHGNPMNAIEENEFHKTWKALAHHLPRPKVILVVSAHWQTNGTQVTSEKSPSTIHDFTGFPPELYAQNYPAPGSPATAKTLIETIKSPLITGTESWGFDHGTWSVLLPMFPDASIPVVQMSLDLHLSPEGHYELAKKLQFLREKGVLIIGSGNVVHNLSRIQWAENATPFDWCMEFDSFVSRHLESGDDLALVNYEELGAVAKLAHPTNEHYLPLLYAAALRIKSDKILFFNDLLIMGSLSMRSVIYY